MISRSHCEHVYDHIGSMMYVTVCVPMCWGSNNILNYTIIYISIAWELIMWYKHQPAYCIAMPTVYNYVKGSILFGNNSKNVHLNFHGWFIVGLLDMPKLVQVSMTTVVNLSHSCKSTAKCY